MFHMPVFHHHQWWDIEMSWTKRLERDGSELNYINIKDFNNDNNNKVCMNV